MGDYLRLLTINDRDIPLATLQRPVPNVAIWSVDHPGILGNYLAIGSEQGVLQNVWATIERNPVGPNTLGAEEVAEFIDSLEAGGPSSAVRWLSEYLETIRAIYAIRIYPEAIVGHRRSRRRGLRRPFGLARRGRRNRPVGRPWIHQRRRPPDLVRSAHGSERNDRGGDPRRVDRRVVPVRAQSRRSRRAVRLSARRDPQAVPASHPSE